MQIRAMARNVVLSRPCVRLYAAYLSRTEPSSQSNESDILYELATDCQVDNSFVEFGFHPREYNCVKLTRSGFKGLLIDGDPQTVRLARHLLPSSVRVECSFLTVDNLNPVRDAFDSIGVLSVDVDGVDYWLLKSLLPAKPAIVCVEYNASFGLRPITVPYSASFLRHAAHPSGWYHGASLTALESLMRDNYLLHSVSESGANAIFVRKDLGLPGSSAETLYRENSLRNQWSGVSASEQWRVICDLPYVTVA